MNCVQERKTAPEVHSPHLIILIGSEFTMKMMSIYGELLALILFFIFFLASSSSQDKLRANRHLAQKVLKTDVEKITYTASLFISS